MGRHSKPGVGTITNVLFSELVSNVRF